jgi:type I restriction-modification system DNA methylase subunit
LSSIVKTYIENINKELKSGHAREHSYRPYLKELLEQISPKISAINEPKQQKVGAPDFVLLKGKTPVGYIEAKDVDINLDKELKTSNQIKRYSVLGNLCFTNYLEFIFYGNQTEYDRVEIAKLVNGKLEFLEQNFTHLHNLLKDFSNRYGLTIASSKQLVSLMADKARLLKETTLNALNDEDDSENSVTRQFHVFRKMLIKDLTPEQFADIYAQTVTYGMFAARYHDKTLETFTRDEANTLLPKSNPFLRNFFQSIAGYNIDERIVWIVDDLAELFSHVNIKSLLENFGKTTQRSDVIIHFYETFLAEYDPLLRKARGVYYTPEPVIGYIIRSVDSILKSEFGISTGIADTSKVEVKKEINGRKQKVLEHRVQILDPATGTGTFLDHTIKHIYSSYFKGQEGLWQTFVDEHLIPRLHEFELLMASYAMAHLKLDITLSETGYSFKKGSGKRLGVYLTNSLEEAEIMHNNLFAT